MRSRLATSLVAAVLVSIPSPAQLVGEPPGSEQWFQQIAPLATSWPASQRQMLHQLEIAANRHFRYTSGWDPSTANNSAQFSQSRFDAANASLQREFLAQLKAMEAGGWPAPLPPNQASDARLNTIYTTVCDKMRAPLSNSDTDAGLPLFVKFQKTDQQLWVEYRDAWTSFVSARYDQSKATLWRAHLTSDRIAQLQAYSQHLPAIDPKAKDWLATCARYRDTPLPAGIPVLPSPAAIPPPNPKSCISSASYYGLGVPVSFAEARRCAILERAEIPTHTVAESNDLEITIGISGPTMLTMLYANGDGVARNTPLAMRFACEAIDNNAIGPPEESSPYNPDEDRAFPPVFLHDVAATGSTSQPKIDMCNFVPGEGRAGTICDSIARLREDFKRTAEINSFTTKFTPDQKGAYVKLVAAFEAYAVAHDDNELVHLGHDPFSAQEENQPTQEKEFIVDMRQFERGDLPSHTRAEYAAADRDLNTEYRQTMEAATRPDPNADETPPSAQNLRDTERLWLTYRDAWVAFGRLRYPQVDEDSWLTWITLRRSEELKRFGEQSN